MTSEQVMLTAALLPALALSACQAPPAERLEGPYLERQVWAVAPFRNEAGTQTARGDAFAEHLVRQLQAASNLDVLPLQRSYLAMEALELDQIDEPAQARSLMRLLNVDGIVVGHLSAWDPYDPPKLGLALELYQGDQRAAFEAANLRWLVRSPVDPGASPQARRDREPVNVVSLYLDASDPGVNDLLKEYAAQRGPDRRERDSWRLYRISMDLYTEFASYVAARALLRAEALRVMPPHLRHSPDPSTPSTTRRR